MSKTLLFLQKLLMSEVWGNAIRADQQIQIIWVLSLVQRINEEFVQLPQGWSRNLPIPPNSGRFFKRKKIKFTFLQPLALSQPSCHRVPSELSIHLPQQPEQQRGAWTLNFIPWVKKTRKLFTNNPFPSRFFWANVSHTENFVGRVWEQQEKKEKSKFNFFLPCRGGAVSWGLSRVILDAIRCSACFSTLIPGRKKKN